jgi:hypothetical protein
LSCPVTQQKGNSDVFGAFGLMVMCFWMYQAVLFILVVTNNH